MHARQQKLLSILLSRSNDYLHIQHLSDQLECSEKTVRNDLKQIEILLSEENWQATLVRKPGYGICLTISDEEKSKLYPYVNHPDYQNEGDTDHTLHIAYQLLMTKSPKTINELATEHFLPKSSVKKDLDQIHDWLENFDLQLVTKQRVGIYIEGTEKNKRRALARLADLSKDQATLIKRLFNSEDVSTIQHELTTFQHQHNLHYTDATITSLTIHVLLMMKRIKIGEPINLSPYEQQDIMQKKEYTWAKEFLQQLERPFVVRFPDAEVAYLTLHILSSKVLTNSMAESEHPSLSPITNFMMKRMTELNDQPFQEDTQLKKGLKTHLHTTLYRLDFAFSVSNPMLEDIKKMYPHMFDQVLHVLEDVYEIFSYKVPEEEAAYITLHFQAALERLTSIESTQKKVVIVCHMGIGMSQLLQTKVERKFQNLTIEGCIAKADVSHYLRERPVDFVISTIPLEHIQAPHIVVSPLLEKEDEQRLETFIKGRSFEEKQESMILQYTSPFLINLQHQPDHRFKLIEAFATQLYKKGYVEEDYIHSCLLRERSAATNIGGGIAIPHGNPSHIKQSAIVIATLSEPVEWGSEKVSFICLLAVHSSNRDVTKRLFQELSDLSEKPEQIHQLTQETDIMTFLSSLQSK